MTTQQTNAPAQDSTNAATVQKLYPEGDKPADVQAAPLPTGEAQAKAPEGEKPKDETPKPDEKKEVTPPANWDLKLPENSALEKAHVDAVTSYAKEKGLTPDLAQDLINRDSTLVKNFVETQQQKFEEQVQTWVKTAETDKEIGGAAHKESVHLANQVATRFGSPELIEGLKSTGFGNHPELIRLLTRIGKAMDNDKLVRPGSSGLTGKKSMEDVFYGSTKN